jgi:hypothetical protein
VSKLPTVEKESGSSEKMWATPQSMDGLRINQVRKKEELSDKAKKGGCSNLREQVIEQADLWPTPRATSRMAYHESPSPSMIKGTHGWSLNAAITDASSEDPYRMWPTPTTMDTKEDSLKHATKMLQGKTHRASGQPIQKTLSDKVMMEEILNNPELMELYQDHQMTERPYLPEQQEFVAYLRSQTTMKELAEKTDIKKTTIEHWFRKDKAGFSHPSIEDWEAIKPHLKELKYDKELTTMESIEWENQKMWPTPTQDMTTERKKKYAQGGKPLTMAVQEEEQKLWPTPMSRDYKGGRTPETLKKSGRSPSNSLPDAIQSKMYPTPRASEVAATITMDAALNRVEKTGYKANLEENVALREQKMFLTPGANEDAAGKPTGKMQRMLGNSPEVRNTGKGTLNPDWVEWLMGYPPGWTDITDLK